MFVIARKFHMQGARFLPSMGVHHIEWYVDILFYWDDANEGDFLGNIDSTDAALKDMIDSKVNGRTLIKLGHGEVSSKYPVLMLAKEPTIWAIAVMIYWYVVELGLDNVASVRITESNGNSIEFKAEFE